MKIALLDTITDKWNTYQQLQKIEEEYKELRNEYLKIKIDYSKLVEETIDLITASVTLLRILEKTGYKDQINAGAKQYEKKMQQRNDEGKIKIERWFNL